MQVHTNKLYFISTCEFKKKKEKKEGRKHVIMDAAERKEDIR
jgi:hypothetical protein